MKNFFSAAIVFFLLTGCTTVLPKYVLPDKTEIENLCHVFILNDVERFKYSWANAQYLKIEGITWNGHAPTLAAGGYAVLPAPLGPLHLIFEYTLHALGSSGVTKTAVEGNCEKGAVLFVYVQTRLLRDAQSVRTSTKWRLVAPPVSAELLEIYRTSRRIKADKLAAYILENAKNDYRVPVRQ